MTRNSDTKKDIIRAIKGLRRLGTPLNYSAVRWTNGPLLVRASERFGSWRAAVKSAGLDYEKICLVHRWTKKEIRDQLLALHKRRQFSNISTLVREYPKLYGACLRRFGGGLAALQAVGIDYEQLLSERPNRWTKAQIVDHIQHRYSEGKVLCRAAILREEPQLKRFCYAATHRFGNWSKALRAAGLDPKTIRNRDGMWPHKRVLEEIHSRYKKGKLLNTDLMLRENLALHAAGRRHFGTWKKAVEKAGVNYNQHVRGGLRGWTRSKTRRAIRDRIDNNRGSRRQIQRQTPSLYRAALHHFGSWHKADRMARSRK